MALLPPLRVTIAKNSPITVSFPDDDCVPAEHSQLDAFLYITFLVSLYLLLPVLGIALGQYEISAVFVAVPETAVDKYGGLVFAQEASSGVP